MLHYSFTDVAANKLFQLMSDDLCFYLFAFSVPFQPNRSKLIPALQSRGPRVVCQRLADI